MDILKVVVLIAYNGTAPVQVAVVRDIATCRQIEVETKKANPTAYDLEVICVPLPLKAFAPGVQ